MSETLFDKVEVQVRCGPSRSSDDPPPKPKMSDAERWVLQVFHATYDRNGEVWLTDYEIQSVVHSWHGRWYGVGSIGARRRDLRKVGHVIESRRREGHRGLFEYRLQEEQEPCESS